MYPSSMCTYEEFQGCRDSFWTHSYNSNTILAPPLRQELTQLFFMGGGGGVKGVAWWESKIRKGKVSGVLKFFALINDNKNQERKM